MSSKKKNIYIYLGKVILITLLIVLFIRCFFIESFTVSSSQMETTLHKNDRILIDKTAYGIRLPVTLLNIPFTFDNIFGMKSYSTIVQIPYRRLFTSQLNKNDVVLFNNPMEIDKPLDKRYLLMSRCVALPGDSIQMQDGLFVVNGKVYEASPGTTNKYRLKCVDFENVNDSMVGLDISTAACHKIADTLFLQLNRLEAYLLKENLPDSLGFMCCDMDTTMVFSFQIPYKGKIIDLNDRNMLLYNNIIRNEQEGKNIRIEGGALFIDDLKKGEYKFEDDYYWMISDNSTNSMDSRILGFIPFKCIIGKARTVWYNPDQALRDNRCFRSIK